MREAIVLIKQTTRMGSLFEELNKVQGIKETLQTFRPHRFMGVYTMLRKFVKCYKSVAEFFLRSGEPFALDREEHHLREITALYPRSQICLTKCSLNVCRSAGCT